jgi:hypothetical protein
MKIADTSFNSTMKRGDTLNRTYRSSNLPEVYTRGSDITIDDKTDTNEQLTVNSEYANGFYVDDFDKIQNKYDAATNYGKDNGVYLSNQVDADVLGEVANATSDVDDGDLGGTDGNGISLTTSNVLKVCAIAKRKIRKQNVSSNDLVAAISPEFSQILAEYNAGRDTAMGDKVGENGYVGRYFGWKFYESNNLTSSAVLSLATQPTNTDTISIAGQTFTFVSSIGTTAGNVLIGANVDATRVNLAAAINDPSTTSATQVALTGENLKLFTNSISAVDSPSGDTCTVTQKGVGVIVVTEALTDATDTWTAAKEIQHNLFCVRGNPTLVMQRMPSVEVKDEPKRFGKNVLNGVLYGVKTFADNAKQMCDVKIRSDAY